jgi:hypothetical protein
MNNFTPQSAQVFAPQGELRVQLASMTSLWTAIEFINNTRSGPAIQTLVLLDDSIPDPHGTNHDPSAPLYQLLKDRYDCQTQLRLRGGDRRLVLELFQKCKLNEDIVTVRFETYEHPPEVRRFFQGRYDGDYGAENDDAAFLVMLSALAQSDPFARVFAMHTNDLQALPVARYGHRRSNTRICREAFNQFQHLDLVFQCSDSGEGNDEEDAREFLAAIPLAKIRSLKTVSAENVRCLDDALVWLWEHAFPNLASLEIVRSEIDHELLLDFLDKTRALTRLHINDCSVNEVPTVLRDRETWLGEINSVTGVNVTVYGSKFSGGPYQDDRERWRKST